MTSYWLCLGAPCKLRSLKVYLYFTRLIMKKDKGYHISKAETSTCDLLPNTSN